MTDSDDVTPMLTAEEALHRLREGNARFVKRLSSFTPNAGSVSSIPWHGGDGVISQRPFAIILGCSDSRVPVEVVFDQGFGDLFVIRVAGNIVAPSQIGSVEFAVSQFATPLVVVLGHSRCGAVEATVRTIRERHKPTTTSWSKNVRAITERIAPFATVLVDELERSGCTQFETLVERAVYANVQASVSELSHGSALIESHVQAGTLTIVGATYSLESGEVTIHERAL